MNVSYIANNMLADCHTLNIIGSYACILLVASILSNTTLIWLYFKHKELQNPLNLLQLSLAILNLVASCIECPTLMLNAFSCQVLIGQAGCMFTGFIMYYAGCVGIYTIMIISFERYWVLHKPANLKALSFKVCSVLISIGSAVGFLWAFLPLVGWSHYSLEGVRVGCAVEWTLRTPSVFSYNVTIFVLVFILPLMVLIFTNYKLLAIMRHSRQGLAGNLSEEQMARRFKKERKLTIITVVQIVLVVVSWLPYSVLAMWIAFIDNSGVSPLLATLPAMFAKTSLVWPSLWTILANNEFKKRLRFIFLNNKVISIETTFNSTLAKVSKIDAN